MPPLVPPSSPMPPLVPPSSPSSPLVPPSSPSPLVPSSSPSSPLVPPSSSMPPLVPSSSSTPPLVPSSSTERPRESEPPECPRESEPPERHRDSALPECPLEVVEFTKNFHGGSSPPLLTETPDPPWPMRSPDPSWLPEAPDLPWPLKLPASVPEPKCALSASCVSVSSSSQSQPGISAPPWWVPDLPESLHVSVDLPESLHVSVDLPGSLHVSVDLPGSLHVSVDLPESPHVSADLPESPHVSADLPESPHASADLPVSPHASADLPVTPRLRRPASHPTPPPTCQSPHASADLPVTPRLRRPARVASRHSGLPSIPSRPCCLVRPALVGSCLIGPTWTWPSIPSPGSTSAPPPSWIVPCVCVKRLEAALWGGGSVMNLVATHHNCTSPLDYIFHHALHTHIPVHHYTNYTAVTIHSLVLITSPHLILTLTYKQHTYTHPLRSLVFPWLTF